MNMVHSKNIQLVETNIVLSVDELDRRLWIYVIKQKDALAIGIMVAAFAATYIFKINVMFVVLACAALGVALSLSRKPGKEGE